MATEAEREATALEKRTICVSPLIIMERERRVKNDPGLRRRIVLKPFQLGFSVKKNRHKELKK